MCVSAITPSPVLYLQLHYSLPTSLCSHLSMNLLHHSHSTLECLSVYLFLFDLFSVWFIRKSCIRHRNRTYYYLTHTLKLYMYIVRPIDHRELGELLQIKIVLNAFLSTMDIPSPIGNDEWRPFSYALKMSSDHGRCPCLSLQMSSTRTSLIFRPCDEPSSITVAYSRTSTI